MALFSPPISSSSLQNPNFIPKFSFSLLSTNRFSLLSVTRASSSDSGITSAAVEAPEPVKVIVKEAPQSTPAVKKEETATATTKNGAVEGEEMKTTESVIKFQDARWINGTWDLKQFEKNGKTDWDAVIVAEAKRRKWLEDNPETTTNDEPVLFDTSTIPWWAWMKRYHLPEAEILNGLIPRKTLKDQ
ncbi:hypothetical protein CARUB_v10005537mg [Capsella rubella]|uniref:Uncharacterized protein n=1 Tax=Capsella rubella TaxID=81985 RepID=R0H1A7_9BRAS|nr:hypothetical protein CARUB_v10005537mg [Capsella rubella]